MSHLFFCEKFLDQHGEKEMTIKKKRGSCGASFLLFPTLVQTRSGSMGIISGIIATPANVDCKVEYLRLNVNQLSEKKHL
jgi:hypothetical protein